MRVLAGVVIDRLICDGAIGFMEVAHLLDDVILVEVLVYVEYTLPIVNCGRSS